MKHLFITLVILASICTSPRPAGANTHALTVGVAESMPPFMYRNEHGQAAGFHVDIVTEAAGVAGIDVTFALMPWRDVLQAFDNGEIDAVAGMNYSVERSHNALFTAPTLKVEYGFYVRKDSPINHPSRLGQRRIAVAGGPYTVDQLTRLYPDARLTPVDDTHIALDMLTAGRVDAAFLPLPSGRYEMNQHPYTEITHIQPSVLVFDTRIAVHPDKQVMFERLDRGFSRIRASAAYERIRSGWFDHPVNAIDRWWSSFLTFVLVFVLIIVILGLNSRMLRSRLERTRSELSETDEYFHLLAEQSVAGTLIVKGSMIVYANRAVTDIIGIDPWAVFPRPIPMEMIHPDDRNLLLERIKMRMNGFAEADHITIRIIRPDGYTLTCELHSRAVVWDGETAIGTTMIGVDQRERTRRQILHTRQTCQAIIEHGPFAVALRDNNLDLLFANAPYIELTGRTGDELKTTRLADMFHESVRDEVMDGLTLVGRGRLPYFRFEAPYIQPDGSTRTASIITARSGANNLITMAVDVTQAKEQQHIIQLQSRLAAMGEMLGVIAHQWQQPLNALSVYISSLGLANARGTLTAESVEQALGGTARQIEYMTRTIDDFRGRFKATVHPERFSAWAVITDIVRMAEVQAKRHSIVIETKTHQPDDDLMVTGMQNEFMNVVFNIIANARDAILQHAKDAPSAARRITISAERNGNDVVIRVEDTGGGINESALSSIFAPYFTTKKLEEGSGIGLYLAKQVIEDGMNGSIRAENKESGAVFTIRVPAVDAGKMAS